MITDFWKGLIIGAIASAVLFGVILFFVVTNTKTKETIRYVEIQQQLEELREDYSNRDPVDFFDTVPGVRGAADGAIDDFEQRKNEILQRFRAELAY